jgi:opacity protein-like surface antigen
MKNILLASAILTALVSPTAFAADSNKSNNGMYGGIDIGFGQVKTDAADTAQALANAAGETVNYSYDKGVGVGRVFLGYNINENISAEIAFFSSTKLDVNYSSAHGVANEDAKATGGDISILLRPSTTSGLNNAFLRLGAQYSKVDGSANLVYTNGGTTTTYTASGNEKGAGFLIGVGYDAALDKNMSARISYTYMDNLGGISGANVNLISAGLKFDF